MVISQYYARLSKPQIVTQTWRQLNSRTWLVRLIRVIPNASSLHKPSSISPSNVLRLYLSMECRFYRPQQHVVVLRASMIFPCLSLPHDRGGKDGSGPDVLPLSLNDSGNRGFRSKSFQVPFKDETDKMETIPFRCEGNKGLV